MQPEACALWRLEGSMTISVYPIEHRAKNLEGDDLYAFLGESVVGIDTLTHDLVGGDVGVILAIVIKTISS